MPIIQPYRRDEGGEQSWQYDSGRILARHGYINHMDQKCVVLEAVGGRVRCAIPRLWASPEILRWFVPGTQVVAYVDLLLPAAEVTLGNEVDVYARRVTKDGYAYYGLCIGNELFLTMIDPSGSAFHWQTAFSGDWGDRAAVARLWEPPT